MLLKWKSPRSIEHKENRRRYTTALVRLLYRRSGFNALPMIARGRVTAEAELNVGCISACRKTWGEEECIILMNISPEAGTADLSAYADWTVAATLSADGGEIIQEGTVLNLPPYGTAVLLPN